MNYRGNLFFIFFSLVILSSCGGGSFQDLALDNVVSGNVSVVNCDILAKNPATANVRVASTGSTATTFGVVPESGDCAIKYTLNNVDLSGTTPFSTILSSALNTGSNTLVVTVGSGASANTFTWNVVKNDPPTCASQTPGTSSNTMNYTDTLNLSVTASDTEADAITYSWRLDGSTTSLFTGVSSSGNNSSATFDPTFTQVGTHTLSVQLYDGYDTTSCSWGVTVNDPATASISSCTPSIGSENPVVITSAGLNSTRTFSVNATGTGLTYAWILDSVPVGGASSAAFNLSVGSVATGNHVLTAQVTDAYSNTASCTFNVKRNAPPVLTVVTPSTSSTQKFNLDSVKVFTVTGSDGNSDTISYTWTLDGLTSAYLPTGSASSTFSPGGVTGLLGTHTVTVLASDGYESDSESWTVDVNYFRDECNNLTSGQVCTLVGSPIVGDNVDLGVAENTNQGNVKVTPRNIIIENVSGTENLIFTDSANHAVWYYNRGSGSISRFGTTINAYSLKVIMGSGQAGQNYTAPIKINTPTGLALNVDNPSSPILYIGDQGNNVVLSLDNSGNVTQILGGGATTDSAIATAGTNVLCTTVWGLAYKAGANQLYVACNGVNTIWRVDTNSPYDATEIVRSGGTTTDGTALNAGVARTFRPRGMTIDSSGNLYWIEQCSNNTNGGVVRVYAPSSATIFDTSVTGGNVATIMGATAIGGAGTACATTSGTFPNIRFQNPWDIVVNSSGMWVSAGTTGDRIMHMNNSGASVTYGNVAVADNNGVWVVNATNTCTTFNGDGNTGTLTCVDDPYGLALGTNKLFFAANLNNRIRNLDLSISAGTVNTNVGSGNIRAGTSGDGDTAATNMIINNPAYLAIDQTNRILYFSEMNQTVPRIRGVDLSSGIVSNKVGKAGGSLSADNILGTDVGLFQPTGLAIYDENLLFGQLYGSVAINRACLLRALNPTSSTNSLFNQTVFSDSVYSLAGDFALGCQNNTNSSYTGGVLASNVAIYDIEGVAVAQDASGNPVVYFNMYTSHCMMKLDSSGILSVAMGTCGTQGNAGTVDITSATLRFPRGLAKDPNNPRNLFIVDQTNQTTSVIRYANFTGSTVTVFNVNVAAGKVQTVLSVSGSPVINDVVAQADQVCYSTGNTASATAGNHNIICKDRDLLESAIDTLRCGVQAGSTVKGGGPLGEEQEAVSCSSVLISGPHGLAFDADGNLYFADRMNHIIRMVKRWY